MSNETDVMLMAYLDGEMDAAARDAFEAKLSEDMPLQNALTRERRLREMLSGAYAPVLNEPVPDRLTALLKTPKAEVVSLAEVRAKVRTKSSLGWAHWGGMAASLMLGTLLGYKLLPSGVSGQMADGNVLAQALDQQLSGQSAGGITPGLSFVAKGGAYCRSFTSTGVQASAGFACREGQQWRLRQLEPLPAGEGASGGYRTAATALPPTLLQSIDALRDGDALDAEAERQARARGWQR